MMMVMLYVSVISLINLLVDYIDLLYPDQLGWYGSIYDSIRYASSALVIGFPVYLLTSRLINRELKKHPEQNEIAVRRWLIYLTLFVAGITIVVDLINFVNEFYSGELTMPFFLKVVAVLVVTLAVFAYYQAVLNKDRNQRLPHRLLAGITSGVLLVLLVTGVFLAGTPGHQRAVRLDEQRVQDLSAIASEVAYYWQQKKELPTNLADLEYDFSNFSTPADPETEASYGYEVTGDLSFQLCAEFALESEADGTPIDRSVAIYPEKSAGQWLHGAGRVCFDREIDPELSQPVIIR